MSLTIQEIEKIVAETLREYSSLRFIEEDATEVKEAEYSFDLVLKRIGILIKGLEDVFNYVANDMKKANPQYTLTVLAATRRELSRIFEYLKNSTDKIDNAVATADTVDISPRKTAVEPVRTTGSEFRHTQATE